MDLYEYLRRVEERLADCELRIAYYESVSGKHAKMGRTCRVPRRSWAPCDKPKRCTESTGHGC